MVRRFLGAATAALLFATTPVPAPIKAQAISCPPDDDALTFEEMIDQGTTGKQRHPTMFLASVSSLKDMGGDPEGGRTVARFDVVEHPVGFVPPSSRVRFWRAFPGYTSLRFEFKHGARYVMIARRLDDGSFKSDDICGQTKRINHSRFRELVRYARSH